jgi:hypothetical protein
VERDIRGLRSDLRAILVEDRERVQRAHLTRSNSKSERRRKNDSGGSSQSSIGMPIRLRKD